MSILITSEWPYCAYPLLAEVYNFCNHECLYCFTKHKETWHNKAKKRKERGFDLKRDLLDIEAFRKAFNGEPCTTQPELLLRSFLDLRHAIQIGGQTDPGGALEVKHRQCFKLLNLLKTDGNSYPIRISTKGPAFADPRYLDIFDGYTNATILISAISTDSRILKKIEPFAPIVEERFRMAKTLSKTGVRLVLRLRPIIPGFTEKTLQQLIGEASDSGFQGVSVDWLRIPRTLTAESKANFLRLSDIIGTDLLKYFKQYSDILDNRNGYLRLKPEHTIRSYDKIRSLCSKYNLRLASCNKDFRCYGTHTPNCCGVPLADKSWNRLQLSYAVHVAKKKGTVRIDDILNINSPLSVLKNRDNGPQAYHQSTYVETLKEIWNDPKHRYYPSSFFPELNYISKDKSNNHIFSYIRPRKKT